MFERMNPHETAPELQKPMFALTKHISQNIDPALFELVKLRASMINGCGHCIDIHSSDALEAGETTARLFGARSQFDERELTYLVAGIGLINMWNRFGVTFQVTPPSALTSAGRRPS
jgi:AhpD family alkylhydroperoxidase